eukprot:TRINITY_DN39173_c0_g1_i1.p1 TRINITY_DN39173_c0_g1~~TRINITY_DN39173_c0_g1_i1.p1  ORF type:complete len:482 (+),score=121.77 TRINITY_DN39173_c0_g1_i1:85-1530(+)
MDSTYLEFSAFLERITTNNQPLITAVAVVARDSFGKAPSVVNAIRDRIINAPLPQKFYAFLVIDAICRMRPDPYIEMFEAHLQSLVASVYEESLRMGDQALSNSIEGLVRSWREGRLFSVPKLDTINMHLALLKQRGTSSTMPGSVPMAVPFAHPSSLSSSGDHPVLPQPPQLPLMPPIPFATPSSSGTVHNPTYPSPHAPTFATLMGLMTHVPNILPQQFHKRFEDTVVATMLDFLLMNCHGTLTPDLKRVFTEKLAFLRQTVPKTLSKGEANTGREDGDRGSTGDKEEKGDKGDKVEKGDDADEEANVKGDDGEGEGNGPSTWKGGRSMLMTTGKREGKMARRANPFSQRRAIPKFAAMWSAEGLRSTQNLTDKLSRKWAQRSDEWFASPAPCVFHSVRPDFLASPKEEKTSKIRSRIEEDCIVEDGKEHCALCGEEFETTFDVKLNEFVFKDSAKDVETGNIYHKKCLEKIPRKKTKW